MRRDKADALSLLVQPVRSTLPPISPSIPSPQSPYTVSSLSYTLFNHRFILPSLCHTHIYFAALACSATREHESMYAIFFKQHRVCVCVCVHICECALKRQEVDRGALLSVMYSQSVGALDLYTQMGCRGTCVCLKDTNVDIQYPLCADLIQFSLPNSSPMDAWSRIIGESL